VPIGNAARQRFAITAAAEWLLDNFHAIENKLRDIRGRLPVGYGIALTDDAQTHRVHVVLD